MWSDHQDLNNFPGQLHMQTRLRIAAVDQQLMNSCANYLGLLSSGSRVGPEILHFYQPPRDIDVAGQWEMQLSFFPPPLPFHSHRWVNVQGPRTWLTAQLSLGQRFIELLKKLSPLKNGDGKFWAGQNRETFFFFLIYCWFPVTHSGNRIVECFRKQPI